MRFFRRKRKEFEDVDPMEFVRRAEAVELRHRKVIRRAERAVRKNDPQGVRDAEAESDVLIDSLADIRLEQITCQQAGWKRKVDRGLTSLDDLGL